MSLSSPPGRFSAWCVSVWQLIYNAYDARFIDEPAGLPAWAKSVPFDVQAKMDDVTTLALQKLSRDEENKQRQLMLQSLLADRFKLRVHNETREQPIYDLVVAKGGPKLKPWPPGVQTKGASWGRSEIRIEGWPIERFASSLDGMVGRPVFDKTGLRGNYDIDLKWTPEDEQGAPDAGPSLLTAIQEQLGLKLVPTKGPVVTFVVDHVERPSEN